MTADTDLIAQVYPDDKFQEYAFKAIVASSRYVPAKVASGGGGDEEEAQNIHLS